MLQSPLQQDGPPQRASFSDRFSSVGALAIVFTQQRDFTIQAPLRPDKPIMNNLKTRPSYAVAGALTYSLGYASSSAVSLMLRSPRINGWELAGVVPLFGYVGVHLWTLLKLFDYIPSLQRFIVNVPRRRRLTAALITQTAYVSAAVAVAGWTLVTLPPQKRPTSMTELSLRAFLEKQKRFRKALLQFYHDQVRDVVAHWLEDVVQSPFVAYAIIIEAAESFPPHQGNMKIHFVALAVCLQKRHPSLNLAGDTSIAVSSEPKEPPAT